MRCRDFGYRNGRPHPACAVALWAAALAALVWFPAAQAGLGDAAAAVAQDRQHMKGQLHESLQSGYDVQQITLPSGTLVREYVAAGKVFAVSWRGPVIPDLRRVLSTYFAQYEAAAAAPHAGGHHHLSIDRPGFVMRASGHMRAHFGIAYVPGLLPQGFSVDDIR